MLFLNRNYYFVNCWCLKVRFPLVRVGRAVRGVPRGEPELWGGDRAGPELFPCGARGGFASPQRPRARARGTRACAAAEVPPCCRGGPGGGRGLAVAQVIKARRPRWPPRGEPRDGRSLAREPGSASCCPRLCRGRGEPAGARSRGSGAVRGWSGASPRPPATAPPGGGAAPTWRTPPWAGPRGRAAAAAPCGWSSCPTRTSSSTSPTTQVQPARCSQGAGRGVRAAAAAPGKGAVQPSSWVLQSIAAGRGLRGRSAPLEPSAECFCPSPALHRLRAGRVRTLGTSSPRSSGSRVPGQRHKELGSSSGLTRLNTRTVKAERGSRCLL